MNKSNKTLIVTVLIALHVVLFLAIIGTNKKDKPAKAQKAPTPVSTPQKQSAPQRTPDSSTHMSGFAVPKISSQKVEPAPRMLAPQPVEVAIPVRVTQNAPQRTQIATPGIKNGYVRCDLQNRRTTQSFASLKGTPYRGAIVVDAHTGKILFEDKPTTYCYPASITKMMTMLLVLEAVDAGQTSLNAKVKITKEGLGVGGSQVYLDIRESGAFTVHNLLQALMIHSACDAGRVLGIHIAGSKDEFIKMMNNKARELGMNATTYHTEHGLPPSGGRQPDISTPHDIAILSLACLRHPETLGYTSTKLAWLPLSSIRKEKMMLANRNALIGKEPYKGCDGLKTGYHNKGGSSLAATAERNGKRVIAIALGCPDKNTRNAAVRKLLDKGFTALGE